MIHRNFNFQKQQAKYLAGVFNSYPEPHANLEAPAFQYKHLGRCWLLSLCPLIDPILPPRQMDRSMK